MVWLEVVATLFLVSFSAYVVVRFREVDKADHAKCMAHVSSVVSDRLLAVYLRELADHYDSAEGQGELATIRNTAHMTGFWGDGYLNGTSIPALWLHAKADALDPTSKPMDYNEVAIGPGSLDEDDPEYLRWQR